MINRTPRPARATAWISRKDLLDGAVGVGSTRCRACGSTRSAAQYSVWLEGSAVDQPPGVVGGLSSDARRHPLAPDMVGELEIEDDARSPTISGAISSSASGLRHRAWNPVEQEAFARSTRRAARGSARSIRSSGTRLPRRRAAYLARAPVAVDRGEPHVAGSRRAECRTPRRSAPPGLPCRIHAGRAAGCRHY